MRLKPLLHLPLKCMDLDATPVLTAGQYVMDSYMAWALEKQHRALRLLYENKSISLLSTKVEAIFWPRLQKTSNLIMNESAVENLHFQGN